MSNVADGTGESEHVVQFYESDDLLCDQVASFLGAGLLAGDPLVVIVTEAHRDAISGRLRARGFDVDGVCAGKQMIILDAEETLARFMVGAHPDAALFSAALGELLDGAVPTVGRPQRLRA